MDPRGTVGRIYKEKYYTLLNIKYESSVSCDFGEESFFYVFFFPIESLSELLTPRVGPFLNPGGMIRRIYVKLHITTLHTKYASFWLL